MSVGRIKKTLTIYDIAKKLNVSHTTVSRALNNSPLLSEGTKKRILKYAQKAGYRPNRLAQSLKRAKTYTIGLIFPNIISAYYSSIIEHIHHHASQRGYEINITLSGWDKNLEKEMFNRLIEQKVDGIIIRSGFQPEEISTHPALHSPCPVVFSGEANEDVSSVAVDIDKGLFAALNHLVERKKKRILVLRYSEKLGDFIRQIKKKTSFKVKIEYEDISIKNETSTVYNGKSRPVGDSLLQVLDNAYNAISNKLASGNFDYDAVIALNDWIAISTIGLLQKHGLTVPDDVAVIGCDDSPLSALSPVPLTTIHQPYGKIAKNLIELLLDKFGKPDKIEKRVLESKLVIRESA